VRRTSGLTLLELVVSLSITGMVVAGAASAYSAAIAYDTHNRLTQDAAASRIQFEQRLKTLLRGAFVSSNQNDPMTYFIGDQAGNNANANAADTITFTTLNEGINSAELTSDDDFETLNQNFGPQGGVAEVSLSLTPVGDAGQTKTGLFIREQRPADGDPTQGGTESVFDADVKTIQFEFYNGTDWDTSWSTSGVTAQSTTTMNVNNTGQDGRRIPAAVRVTYSLSADPEGYQRVLIVLLPHSDVTAANPIVLTGGTTTGP
jgi:type II secretory pathway pseudopilin PulG